MPRGGKRPGAGRKKGSATKKTRAVADKAAEKGIMPLEVMLEVMRKHYTAGNLHVAAEIARHAAPYVHPRLGAIQHTGKEGEPIELNITEVIVTNREEAAAVLARNRPTRAIPR